MLRRWWRPERLSRFPALRFGQLLRLVFEPGATTGGEELVLLLRDGVGLFAGDLAGSGQDGALVQAQEVVEPALPGVQEDLLAPPGTPGARWRGFAPAARRSSRYSLGPEDS